MCINQYKLFYSNKAKKILGVVVITLSLNTAVNAAAQNTFPSVISTIPASEQSNVATNEKIKVIFNKAIMPVNSEQVTLHQFINNKLDFDNPVALDPVTPFNFDLTSNTLIIKPAMSALLSATKYQVTLQNIKDTTNLDMAKTCKWVFATVGFGSIATGNGGVCGSASISVAPGLPQNLVATAGNGSVTVNWSSPVTGSTATYYKLERSINGAGYTLLNSNLTAASFIDTVITNGSSYQYRVFAGNNTGLSAGVVSNTVTPVSVAVIPGAPQNVAAVAGDGMVTVDWSAPVTGDKVTYYKVDKSVNGAAFVLFMSNIPATTIQVIDTAALNGASHVYRVTAGNAVGLGIATLSNAVTPMVVLPTVSRVNLISQSPATNNYFGLQMAFTPDGNTIAVGESNGDPVGLNDVGGVQLFTKSNGAWLRTQLLTEQTPMTASGFGYSVAISQDGSTLAVGGTATQFVNLYTKSGALWVFTQALVSPTSSATGFGKTIAFHPNSTILAIGEHTASINGIPAAGAVQLFSKVGSSWFFSQSLVAQQPTVNNEFGTLVKFSPDGSTLAVSEMRGDSSIVIDAGAVQLFAQAGTNWMLSQILTSNAPVSNNQFGGSGIGGEISFSPDSRSLAIGETIANNVQLFSRAGNVWNRSQILTVANAMGNFGMALSYSADGNTLAVGEFSGRSNGVSGAGNVYLFNKSVSNWILNRAISAQVPAVGNYFGYSLNFSPIGNELAIGEINGDTAVAANAGIVSIIDILQLP